VSPLFPTGRVAVHLPDPRTVAPADQVRVAHLPELVRLAAPALAQELGAFPEVVDTPPPWRGPRWELRLAGVEPAHHVDRAAKVLVTEAPTMDGLLDALSTLRDLSRRPDGRWPVRDCADVEELITRVRDAVADTVPSLASRGLDWAALTARHAPRVRAATDPLDAVRCWIAELGDAHCAVHAGGPNGRLPYALHCGPDRVVFWEVPATSAAFAAGVRPGWRLDVDPAHLLARTGASPHARPWVAGALAVSGPVGVPRTYAALGPGGRRVPFTEAPEAPFAAPNLTVGALPSGAPIVHVRAFPPGLSELLAPVWRNLRGDRLVIDLRGNGGGNLAEAWRLRDRFLDPGPVGTIRTTLPGGALGPPVALVGGAVDRWRGRVHFLTDARTYSASEDALLGLQGLPHVRVVGRASGGGSGRVRRVRLLPGAVLTLSTALTWDRRQRCVEGQGIPVDVETPWSDPTAPDPALAAADRW
jgi:carboxyl-terminal processing protease